MRTLVSVLLAVALVSGATERTARAEEDFGSAAAESTATAREEPRSSTDASTASPDQGLGDTAAESTAPAEEELDLQLTPALTLTPESAPGYQLTYEEYKLQELERTALRSRNALIGTSVAAAVGLALVIPAASSQCESVEVAGEKEYQCTRAGDVLLRVGSPLVIGGLTGAVVSGIILGVRKGKIRRLNDSFSPTKSRAVRWDERSSRFVF